jgi:acyl transferase domain-containing protein
MALLEFMSLEAVVSTGGFRDLSAVQLSNEHGRKGAMLALSTNAHQSLTLLRENTEGYATLAAINSAQSVTLSGDKSAIDNVHRMANVRGIFARRLIVEVSYHSRHMELVAAFYLASIDPFCKTVSIPTNRDAFRPAFISSVTGEKMELKL